MKKLLPILTLLISTSAFADLNTDTIRSAGWDKLTEKQKADLIQQVTTQAATPVTVLGNSLDKAKEIDEWVQVGSHIGLGLVGAAKELGIAVNDFVKTPVGILTTVIIVWQFIGGPMIHTLGSIIILVVGLSFTRWYANKTVRNTIDYDSSKTDWFGRSRLIKEDKPAMPGDDLVWSAIFVIATLISSMVVLFSF